MSSVIQPVCTHVTTAGGYSPGSNAHVAYFKQSAVVPRSLYSPITMPGELFHNTSAESCIPNALWLNASSVLAHRITNRLAINRRSNIWAREWAIQEERSIYRNVIVSVSVRNEVHMQMCLFYEWLPPQGC